MKISSLTLPLSIVAVASSAWWLGRPAIAAPATQPAPLALTNSAAAAEGITVTVTGKHLAAASQLSITTKLQAFGATGAEAAQAFEQRLARSLAGLNDTGLEGVSVHPGGYNSSYGAEAKELDQNAMNGMFIMDGSGPQEEDKGLNLWQSLELQIPAAANAQEQRAQLAELVDASVDLGLKFQNGDASFSNRPRRATFGGEAPATMVRGELSEEATIAAELAAQADAMARAERQAGQLAALGGRELGNVTSINQRSLDSTWKGMGQGTEFQCVLVVTFAAN